MAIIDCRVPWKSNIHSSGLNLRMSATSADSAVIPETEEQDAGLRAGDAVCRAVIIFRDNKTFRKDSVSYTEEPASSWVRYAAGSLIVSRVSGCRGQVDTKMDKSRRSGTCLIVPVDPRIVQEGKLLLRLFKSGLLYQRGCIAFCSMRPFCSVHECFLLYIHNYIVCIKTCRL